MGAKEDDECGHLFFGIIGRLYLFACCIMSLTFCYPSIERNFFLKSMGGGGGVSGSKL